MDSPWNPAILMGDTEWLLDGPNFDNMSLDPPIFEDMFPEAWGDPFASLENPESGEEPFLSGDFAYEPQKDLSRHSEFDLMCAGDSGGDNHHEELLQNRPSFEFSSYEGIRNDTQEIKPKNGADVGDSNTAVTYGWQKVPQDPGSDDLLSTETRGRPRRSSIRMVCRAGEISSSRRLPRPVQRSVSSWNEQDNLENFCGSIKKRLDEIGDPDSRNEKYFITDYLSREKRRLVHALAHLGRFNHMTLDETKERRILITTATISCKANHPLNKCWNQQQSQWKLDPRTLILSLPKSIEYDHLRSTLTDLNLPLPHSHHQMADSPDRKLFLAEFDTAGDAARVIDRLQARHPNVQTESSADNFASIDVSYRYWSEGTATDATFREFGDLKDQQAWSDKILFSPRQDYHQSKAKKYPPVSYRYAWSRSFNQRRMSRGTSNRETDSSDGNGSSRSRSSSKRPFLELEADLSQRSHVYLDLSNDDLKIPDQGLSRDASSDSTAKRRRLPKLPKQAAGYECKEPGCGKKFDYNGELTKHVRIHKPKEERPYACQHCEQRFIEKKDLVRHGKVHLTGRLLEVRGENHGWYSA